MSEPEFVCWLAYYTDYSNMVCFAEEVDALRWAVTNNMQVKKLYEGEEFGP